MELLKKIQRELRAASDEEGRAATRKFVPSARKVYGARMPVLEKMAQAYRSGGFELVESLWHSGAYEEQVLAAKILGRIGKKDPEKTLNLIGKFSSAITDWAVCDAVGMQATRGIREGNSSAIFAISNTLSTSKNPWQRRLSLVLLEYYTRYPEHKAAIQKIITRLEGDDEYYVKKAVVWIKRNFTKSR